MLGKCNLHVGKCNLHVGRCNLHVGKVAIYWTCWWNLNVGNMRVSSVCVLSGKVSTLPRVHLVASSASITYPDSIVQWLDILWIVNISF